MTRLTHRCFRAALALAALAPAWAAAIDFDEVREYDDVFALSLTAPARDRLEARWEIAEDYYLYDNRFLEFRVETEGVVLGEPVIPPGKKSFDELLGEEVVKHTEAWTITLPLDSVPAGVDEVAVRIRSQGCLESVLCYPPTWQSATVALPAAAGDADEPSAFAGTLGVAPVTDLIGDEDDALSPEQAFTYEVIGLDAGTALARFTPARGYYLYRDQFAFEALEDGVAVREVSLPPGEIKDDPEFGRVQVYFDQVEIPVRLNRPAGPARTVTLRADFQGCRDGDICYPPMQREVAFELEAAERDLDATVATDAAAPASAEPPLSEQDSLAGLLLSSPVKAMLAFFVAGLLLAFTPCVFPMVPILSGIIMGEGDRLTTARAFWLSLVYVLAMAVTYTAAGVLAGLFGQNLQATFQNPWIISAFVLVFVLLALSMFGFYELQLPARWQSRLTEVSNRQGGGRLGGVAVMGFLSALIVGPCVAPPLAAALIVIGSSGDPVLGGGALFAMAMGMGVPLLVFGVSAGKLVPRAGAWMDAVKAFFGVGLLALSIWMLERILPPTVILFLWGVLLVGCGVYLGALERIPEGASGWRRLWKSLGLVLLLLGALELIGAASGGQNWLRPLDGVRAAGGAGGKAEASHVEFRRIKSLGDLEQAVAAHAAEGRVTMLDFYADWCVECVRMERNTFPDPGVAALLERIRPLQADVTANDDTDQALMRAYGIIGPPAILFFDAAGDEMRRYRLVGYFDPDEFSAHVERVLAAR